MQNNRKDPTTTNSNSSSTGGARLGGGNSSSRSSHSRKAAGRSKDITSSSSSSSDPFQAAADELDVLVHDIESLKVVIDSQFHGGLHVFSVISREFIEAHEVAARHHQNADSDSVSLTAPSPPPPNRYVSVGPYNHQVDLLQELTRFNQSLDRMSDHLSTAMEDCQLLGDVVAMLQSQQQQQQLAAGGAELSGSHHQPSSSSSSSSSLSRHQRHITPAVIKQRFEFVAGRKQRLEALESFTDTMRKECEERLSFFSFADQRGAAATSSSSGASSQSRQHYSHSGGNQTRTTSSINIGDGGGAAKGCTGGGGDAWDEQEALSQTELRNEQSRALDTLHHGIVGLKSKASTIGTEVVDQMGELDEVQADINTVHGRLQLATKKVNFLLENMSNRGKNCCIFILIIVLTLLLMALIFS